MSERQYSTRPRRHLVFAPAASRVGSSGFINPRCSIVSGSNYGRLTCYNVITHTSHHLDLRTGRLRVLIINSGNTATAVRDTDDLGVSCHHTEILLFCSPAGRPPPDTLPVHPAASPCPTLLLAVLPCPTLYCHSAPPCYTLPAGFPCPTLHPARVWLTLHPCPIRSALPAHRVKGSFIIPHTIY